MKNTLKEKYTRLLASRKPKKVEIMELIESLEAINRTN